MEKTLPVKSAEFIALCEKYDVNPEGIPEIMTVEAAFSARGLDPLLLPDVSMLPERFQDALLFSYQTFVVNEALNEGWQPDWSNTSEPKYFPVFEYKKAGRSSGFGFSFFGGLGWYSYSSVGSRFVLRTRNLARFAGKHFLKEYKKAYSLP